MRRKLDSVFQKAEAEFVVAEDGEAVGVALVVADIGKGKEEEVVLEAEVKDAYTGLGKNLIPFEFVFFSA
jgi:hypothetical protein